jgi:molybdopterin molybdotransferase
MKRDSANIAVSISDGPLARSAPPAAQPGGGAMVCFEGIVRRLENDQPIDGLHYQAYQPMAERQIRRIAEELIASRGLLSISVEHSVGWIPVGQCSFRLMVVAPHRKEAFDAMQEFIDRLKRDVPIWKSVATPMHSPANPPEVQSQISPGRIIPRRLDTSADSPIAIVHRLAEECAIVPSVIVDIEQSAGRVLAEPIVADRDHPGCDVSAIDGYALRLNQIEERRLAIAFEMRIGQPPRAMPEAGVVKIVTGAAVPKGAEVLIRRELVEEYSDHIVIPDSVVPKAGQDLRRRGENARAGESILDAGTRVTPAAMSAMASFGISRPSVRAKARVGVIIGGDELVDVQQTPQPWEVRESNGLAMQTLLRAVPWVELIGCKRVADDQATIAAALEESLNTCDAVLLSGGVSMGDRDFVPAAVQRVGGRVIYHGLPVRPGRPMLGAVGPRGQAILGLPGNPLSVMTATRRFVAIVLRKIAGLAVLDPPTPVVCLESPIAADSKFWLFRPVQLTRDGLAAPLPVKSSGDLVGAARSDGFVQIPPASTAMTVPFFRWSLE